MNGIAQGVSGIVLAGGRGRRMGGVDKGLQLLRGKPMVRWVIERLSPQVDEVLINANQNIAAYESFGNRVVSDEVGGFAGPLAGLASGMAVAAQPLVVTVPCDSPFLPADLVARLRAALEANDADLAVARTGAQPHPVFALTRRRLSTGLAAFLSAGGRKIDAWYAPLKTVEVPFDDQPDAFLNINTRDELEESERR
jgi:molybdopterin-guanine dinucleotide biosynthesis protein A